MKKALLFFLFFLSPSLFTYPAYYWDYPRFIAKNTEFETIYDLRVIRGNGKIMIFYLSQGKNRAKIEFFTTGDLINFLGPFSTGKGIDIKEKFSPGYDVMLYKENLFLVWHTFEGQLIFASSRDMGENWEKEKVLISPGPFSFGPRIFVENDELFLFYHTESEGRKIDFYFLKSTDNGETWTRPLQVAKGFQGSFFPYLDFYRGNLYLVWQSRPFSEAETSVFHIYLSISRDSGSSWSSPVNLTENFKGENVSPLILLEDERLFLIWENDGDGAWGIHHGVYDLTGKPVSSPFKINKSLVNTRSPRLIYPFWDKGEIGVFYIDERDGNRRIYFSTLRESKVEESGPLGEKGIDVLNYFPVAIENRVSVFLQDERGLLFLGSDIKASKAKIIPLKSNYIGKGGVTISWEKPFDPAGIEGYSYSFDRDEQGEPEIVNLPPYATSLPLEAKEEGEYYFHLRAKDGAGNYSETETIPLIFDFTPPPRPDIALPELDEEGFYRGNSPLFQWQAEAYDVEGYSYVLSKRIEKIEKPEILTKKSEVKFRGLKGGTWYFNVIAVDRAGNLSETSHLEVRFKPLPSRPKPLLEEKQVKLAPPWSIFKYSFKANPFLNITLYIVLLGLLTSTFFIAFELILKILTSVKGVYIKKMEEMIGERKKRFGLRFKFSLLIGALVLLLTIGIGTVLSIVTLEQEKEALANQMLDKANLSLENMTNVAREGILNDDELLLLTVITKTMENKEIKYSIILDTKNRVIAHSDINERGKVLTDEFTELSSKAETLLIKPEFHPEKLAEIYDLASPIVFAGKRIGTVRLGYSTETIFNTIAEARRNSIYSTIIITLITVVLGIVGAIVMASITIKPIKILANGANIIGGGKLDYRIEVKARDEIGLLADEFNRMTKRLLEYQREMEKKAKLDEQLQIARKIQEDMIPHGGIDTDYLSIDGYYRAASMVSGDYFDFIPVGKGKYGVMMSDVAGKGVPASLMMIMIRTIFKSLIQSGVSDPARVVTLMNSTLSADIASDRFVSLIFGVFEKKSQLFRYTNAGYGPILVYRDEEKQCFVVTPSEGSVPVGVMPEVRYAEENPIRLLRGDAVFLFTDGIHEARNERSEEYGMNRLSEIIPQLAGRDSNEMANLIISDVLKFVGKAEQHDDMTLLVMKMK